jgi:CheY-like chemotaxis protein
MGDSRQGVLTGLHILIAEDDLDAREILNSLLRYFGAHVTTVSNARDAVAALTS